MNLLSKSQLAKELKRSEDEAILETITNFVEGRIPPKSLKVAFDLNQIDNVKGLGQSFMSIYLDGGLVDEDLSKITFKNVLKQLIKDKVLTNQLIGAEFKKLWDGCNKEAKAVFLLNMAKRKMYGNLETIFPDIVNKGYSGVAIANFIQERLTNRGQIYSTIT